MGNLQVACLHTALTSEGAVRPEGDRCLCKIKVDGIDGAVEVHADDILAACHKFMVVIKVKKLLAKHFDLGDVKYFLGMDIMWDRVRRTVSLGNPQHHSRADGTLYDGGEPRQRFTMVTGTYMRV